MVMPTKPQPTANDAAPKPDYDNANPWMDSARQYIKLGWWVVPCPRGEKRSIKGWAWSKRKLEEAELPQYFSDPQTAHNVGIVTGDKSKGLVDIDLDWPQASAFGDILFADCPVFGRAGKQRSHRLVQCPGAKSSQFELPTTAATHPMLPKDHALVVAEIRAGGITIFPYSIHASGEPIRVASQGVELPVLTPDELKHRVGLVAFCSVVARLFPPDGSRHNTLLALSGALCRVPWIAARDDCVEFVNQLVTQIASLAGCHARPSDRTLASPTFNKLDDDDAHIWGMPKVCEALGLPEECIKLFNKWLGLAADKETTTKDGRPLIEFNEVDLTPMLDATETVMREREAPVFQRAGKLVHVYRLDRQHELDADRKETDIERKPGALVIRDMEREQLRECMSNHIQFFTWEREKDEFVQAPIAMPWVVVRHTAARSERWRLRSLSGMAGTPFMRRDGTIASEPGHDAESGIYIDTGGIEFPPIGTTEDDARKAMALLKTPYAEFPFVNKASRSVALSSSLTVVSRPTMGFVPLHGFDAPTMGAGKTLGANIAAYTGTGHDAAVMTLGWNEDENEKRLTGVLLGGDPVALMDNIKRPVDGDLLNAMHTSEYVKIRVLGVTGQIAVRNCATVLATGNGLQFEGDMVKRVVIARIDPQLENPEHRTFTGVARDLPQYLKEHRPALVSACLTILRAYVCAGRPGSKDIKPSRFPEWDHLVRGALLWLGEADPMDTQAGVTSGDTVRADLGALLEAIHEHPTLTKCDGGLFTAKVVADCAWVPGNLHDAVTAVVPKQTTKGVSAYLKGKAGRIVDGWSIESVWNSDAERTEFRLRHSSKTVEQGTFELTGDYR
jgi:hypothetical protein